MKQKKQKGGFLSMILRTLGASLLGNLLTGKGIVKAGTGRRSLSSSTLYCPSSSASQNKKGKEIARAGSGHSSNENK